MKDITDERRTKLARHILRPLPTDYLWALFSSVIEVSGDGMCQDDAAIFTGIGRFENCPVVVIASRKGRETREKVACNFGMVRPSGYRKCIRAIKIAEKFCLPVISIVDTPGAFPGVDAELAGQSEAIAKCIDCLLNAHIPTVAVITGEGGSGGALALAAADRVGMMEHAIYSVISPEGCAAILWKSAAKADLAASAMGISAQFLLQSGLVDVVVPEPPGGAHCNVLLASDLVRTFIRESLAMLSSMTAEELRCARLERSLRLMGISGNGS